MRFITLTISAFIAAATAADLGSWTFYTYEDEYFMANSGHYRTMLLQYSGQDTNITCEFDHPAQFESGPPPPDTWTCSEPSFNYTLGALTKIDGPLLYAQTITPIQTVTIGGKEETITGTGNITVKGDQGSGFTYLEEGTNIIEATEVVG